MKRRNFWQNSNKTDIIKWISENKYDIISWASFIVGLIVIVALIVAKWDCFNACYYPEYETMKSLKNIERMLEEQRLNEWKRQQNRAKTFK